MWQRNSSYATISAPVQFLLLLKFQTLIEREEKLVILKIECSRKKDNILVKWDRAMKILQKLKIKYDLLMCQSNQYKTA